MVQSALSLLLLILTRTMMYDYIVQKLYAGGIIPFRLLLMIVLLVLINMKALFYQLMALGMAIVQLADIIHVYMKEYHGIAHQFVFNNVMALLNINYGRYSGISFLLSCLLYLAIVLYCSALIVDHLKIRKEKVL